MVRLYEVSFESSVETTQVRPGFRKHDPPREYRSKESVQFSVVAYSITDAIHKAQRHLRNVPVKSPRLSFSIDSIRRGEEVVV